MTAAYLALAVFVTAFTWWLGLYLLERDARDVRLTSAGLGLLGYALALAFDPLARAAAEVPLPVAAAWLSRLHGALVLTPALLWSVTLLRLLPDDVSDDAPDEGHAAGGTRRVERALPLVATVALLLALLGANAQPAIRVLVAALVLLPLVAGLAAVVRGAQQATARAPLGVVLTGGMFFALGVALLLWPPAPLLGSVPQELLLLGLGFDLLLLGVGLALFDALELGEAAAPDMARSLLAAALAAVAFGGQVALVLAVTGPEASTRFGLLALLFGVTLAAVTAATLAESLQDVRDRLVFRRAPATRRERAELRAAARALPRRDPAAGEALAGLQLDEATMQRLTRRALANFGDLGRLAASPLTELPLIDRRLAARGASGTLERAQELKRLLAEAIERLKPDGGAFGSSDEWRHYNVLFFPYVMGVKPFSRRLDASRLDAVSREALEWLRTHVPERTFYNWQNAAARLVARDLLERSREVAADGPAREP